MSVAFPFPFFAEKLLFFRKPTNLIKINQNTISMLFQLYAYEAMNYPKELASQRKTSSESFSLNLGSERLKSLLEEGVSLK